MNSGTLRSGLRTATAALHDRLDGAMTFDLGNRAAYSRFLRIQLSARSGVERWLATTAPADLVPPAMSPLLVDDLSALGLPFSLSVARFAPDRPVDPIGAAWVLAGSHLGNRAMMAQLPDSLSLPTSFLSDRSLGDFWRNLLPQLNAPADGEQLELAAAGAVAVFHHFLAICEADRHRLAA